MREKILARPMGWTVFLCAALVLFGCCFFPVYQLAPDFAYSFWWLNAPMAARAYWEIGQLLGILHGWRRRFLLAFGMTLLGFACRFLLEYGEVANTVNFTLPNMGLHLCAAVSITVLASLPHAEKV